MKLFKALFAASALALAISAPVAAAPGDTYSDTFQGVTFNITEVDSNTFTFQILNALTGATPDWDDAEFLGGFDFKNMGVDFSTATATAFYEPAGPSIPGTNTQINANGCGSGSPDSSICFSIIPPLALDDDMLFRIDITGGTLAIDSATGPHLQILFCSALDASGDQCDKTGSLYSEDVPLSTSSTSGGGATGGAPEPHSTGILALMGLGMIAGAFRARRRR
jgi:hypothetical protein